MSPRPTTAIIDLENLKFNFRSVKSFVGGSPMCMAVIKADAYGHGTKECAVALDQAGADWFGVATLEEAMELRTAGIGKPILCFGGVWPGQESEFLKFDITPLIFDIQTAKRISNAAGIGTARVHVKIDTGMGRVGVPFAEAAAFAAELSFLRNLEVEAIMSHFAAADDPDEADFTHLQIDRFHAAVAEFQSRGTRPRFLDIANSPGAVAFPSSTEDMIRIGGLLFGLGGDVLPPNVEKPELKPVMSLVTKVAQVKRVPPGTTLGYGRTFTAERESVIGTIPIGYHDGYRRGLTNKGRVIINGEYAPVAGRVSMDWTIVDLTDVPEPTVGAEVILIGRQGQRTLLAEDLAREASTISYEITCGISGRIPRVYVNG